MTRSGFRSPLPRTRFDLSLSAFTGCGLQLLASIGGSGTRKSAPVFEDALGKYVGRRYCVATGSGKAALVLSLKALNLRPGSRILMPAFLVPEVAAVIIAAGLRPLIVDVDEDTFGLNVERVEQSLTPDTSAILVAHLYGTPCEIEPICQLAESRGIHVIEDAAQAIGATISGRPAGSFGRISYVSTGIYKNLNTLAGGAVLTDDEALAQVIRRQRDESVPVPRRLLAKEWLRWGALAVVTRPAIFRWTAWPVIRAMERVSSGSSDSVAHRPAADYLEGTLDCEALPLGFTGVQADLGIRQLRRLDSCTRIRVENGMVLDRALSKIPGIRVQSVPAGYRSIRLNYVVRVPEREQVIPRIRQEVGIDVAPGYLYNLAAIPAFGPYAREAPVADSIERDHIYVPVQHPVRIERFKGMACRLAEILEDHVSSVINGDSTGVR